MKAQIAGDRLDRLKAMYVDLGLGCKVIAAELGHSPTTILATLRRAGIAIRTRVEPPRIVFDDIVYSWDGRYFRSTKTFDGQRKYLHREVWIKFNGPIPEGHEVHHRNEDRTDNLPTNLELKSKSWHASEHAAKKRRTPGGRFTTQEAFDKGITACTSGL